MRTHYVTFFSALAAAGPGINPNPNPNFDPSTSQGTLGPFTVATKAAAGANGGPGSVDPQSKQAMQLAISNWMTDTGIVSGFLDNGAATTNNEQGFKGIADGAFKAEVDELSQKAVLDSVIGQDPRVSIANQTLTNGVFQSVVDNLQIMSIQGTNTANLIDTINSVRCTQILPSIDTYMLVAAEYIGQTAQQRRSVRPDACGQILAQAQNTDFPPVPGTPNGNPQGKGDGQVTGVPNVGQKGVGLPGGTGNTVGGGNGGNTNAGNGNAGNGTAAAGGNTGNSNAGGNGNGKASGGKTGKNGGGNAGNAGNAGNNNAGSAANAPLNNVTTPQLSLPAFQQTGAGANTQQGAGNAGNGNGNAGNGNAGNGNAGGGANNGAAGQTGQAGQAGAQKGGAGAAGNGKAGNGGGAAAGKGQGQGAGGAKAGNNGAQGGAQGGNGQGGNGGAQAGGRGNWIHTRSNLGLGPKGLYFAKAKY